MPHRTGSTPQAFAHEFPPGLNLPDCFLTEILLTIDEGKFHQIKRMVAAVGCEVLYLKRIAMGAYTLPEDLARGQWIQVERKI